MKVRNANGAECKESEFLFDHENGTVALIVRFNDPKSLQQAVLALGRVEKDWRESWKPGTWSSIVLTCSEMREPRSKKKKAKR